MAFIDGNQVRAQLAQDPYRYDKGAFRDALDAVYGVGAVGKWTSATRRARINVLKAYMQQNGIAPTDVTGMTNLFRQVANNQGANLQIEHLRNSYARNERKDKIEGIYRPAAIIGGSIATAGLLGAGAGDGVAAADSAPAYTVSGTTTGIAPTSAGYGSTSYGINPSNYTIGGSGAGAAATSTPWYTSLYNATNSILKPVANTAGMYNLYQNIRGAGQQQRQADDLSQLRNDILSDLSGDDDAMAAKYSQEYMRRAEPRYAAGMYQRGLQGSGGYGAGLANLTNQAVFAGEQMRGARANERINLLSALNNPIQNANTQTQLNSDRNASLMAGIGNQGLDYIWNPKTYTK